MAHAVAQRRESYDAHDNLGLNQFLKTLRQEGKAKPVVISGIEVSANETDTVQDLLEKQRKAAKQSS